MRKKKGFTLIEILIVIVILATLATIVLPKMLAQPEAALLAEANYQLGALARAQQSYIQMSGQPNGLEFTDPGSDAEWNKLGLQKPTNAKFTYGCTGTACTASKSVNGENSTIVLTYNSASGVRYTDCTGAYSKSWNGSEGGSTRGCIMVG